MPLLLALSPENHVLTDLVPSTFLAILRFPSVDAHVLLPCCVLSHGVVSVETTTYNMAGSIIVGGRLCRRYPAYMKFPRAPPTLLYGVKG